MSHSTTPARLVERVCREDRSRCAACPIGLVRKEARRTGLLVSSHAGSHGGGAWSVWAKAQEAKEQGHAACQCAPDRGDLLPCGDQSHLRRRIHRRNNGGNDVPTSRRG